MKLSLREYDAMQSGWRKWINEHMEIGGFKAWGMDFTGKGILEVGCGSGFSASCTGITPWPPAAPCAITGSFRTRFRSLSNEQQHNRSKSWS